MGGKLLVATQNICTNVQSYICIILYIYTVNTSIKYIYQSQDLHIELAHSLAGGGKTPGTDPPNLRMIEEVNLRKLYLFVDAKIFMNAITNVT